VLYGHSFGGLLALEQLLSHPAAYACAIIESPFLGTGFPIPAWKVWLGSRVAQIFPAAPFHMDLKLSGLCTARNMVEAYKQDPLVHNTMTAQTFLSIEAVQAKVMHATTLACPILMLTGGKDTIADVPKARTWFHNLRSAKESHHLPEAAHEMHNEPSFFQTLSRCLVFIDAHQK
jgi:alpha-beta hydrolase superfamily lysophospholipase